jgi:hypothetical protein
MPSPENNYDYQEATEPRSTEPLEPRQGSSSEEVSSLSAHHHSFGQATTER